MHRRDEVPSFFLLLLFLVAVASGAAQQNSEHDLLRNGNTNTTRPDIGIQTEISITLVLTKTGPNDLVLNYNGLFSGPEPEDRLPNVSAPTSAFTGMYTDPTTGSHGAIIRMGMSKQYVAELKGQRM